MRYTISVVIPTYNRADFLPRACDSVMAQTMPANEIIVVDDASADDSVNLIEKHYPQIKLIRHPFNRGVSAARNSGITQASGEWIALLDSDDEWFPSKLQTQIELLKNMPDYKICHTNEIWIRDGVRVNQMQKHQKQGGDLFQRSLALCLISPSSVLIHRSVFEEVGLFDRTLLACEDYDFWLRTCSRYLVLYSKEALLIKYGGHKDQLSKKFWGMDRMRIRSIKKILKDPSLSAENRNAAIQMLIKKSKVLVKGAKKRDNQTMFRYYSKLVAEYSSEESGEPL